MHLRFQEIILQFSYICTLKNAGAWNLESFFTIDFNPLYFGYSFRIFPELLIMHASFMQLNSELHVK